MRTLGFVVLAFVATFVATFAVVVFGTLIYWEVAGVQDRDGGGAMGIVFVIGPMVATLAAVAAAATTAVAMNRRRAAVVAGTRAPTRRWPIGVRALVAAVAWSAAVYGAFAVSYWLASPMSFDSYATAIIVTWLPTVAALITGVVAAIVVLMRRGPNRRV